MSFQRNLIKLVQVEAEQEIKPEMVRVQEQSFSQPLALRPQTEASSITQLLAEEAIIHIANGVHYPPPVLTFRSRHPYESHAEMREKIQVPGASKLLISFHAKSSVGSDVLTRLSFYRDNQLQDLIGTFNGKRFQSFAVPGDRVWFKFQAGTNSSHWGFEFTVTPVDLKLNDIQAVKGQNFSLGAWLVHFMLAHLPTAIHPTYLLDLYKALTWYVFSSEPSAMIRGVHLLTRLLLHWWQLIRDGNASAVPLTELAKLTPLVAHVKQVLRTIKLQNHVSNAIQSLVELLATRDLHSQPEDEGHDSDADVEERAEMESLELEEVVRVGLAQVEITEGTYGSAEIEVGKLYHVFFLCSSCRCI